jgi:hypothetical protein
LQRFASERLGSWAVGGGAPYEPVTGDWQMATDHDDVAYKRLATMSSRFVQESVNGAERLPS